MGGRRSWCWADVDRGVGAGALPWLALALPALCLGLLSLAFGFKAAYLTTLALALVYVLLIVPRILTCDNREGIQRLAARDFAGALVAFQRSEQIWRRRPLIDRWHIPLLMSASPHSLVEIARTNQATTLARMGKVDEAIALHELVVAEDPDLFLASEALEMPKLVRAGARREAAAGAGAA